MTASTAQFRRVCQVIIGETVVTAAGQRVGVGLSVTELRIQFEITKTKARHPNHANVKIYNLSPDHAGQIKGEFDEILVNAGYEGAALLVFRGNIKEATHYRSGPDYITEVDAGDGDRDFRNTIVNTTLAKGTTTTQLLDHIVGKFTTTKRGHTVIKERSRIRGRVISAAAHDVLDDLAAESDASWSIQDGNLDIVPVDSTLPTEAIVLRSDTGLLGAPELSDKGIKATCLLNPRIRVNGKVKIDNNDLKLKIAKQRDSKPGAKHRKPKAAKQLARLDPDGIYKVIKLVHKGDTRGRDWTTEVLCVSLAKSIPAGKAAA